MDLFATLRAQKFLIALPFILLAGFLYFTQKPKDSPFQTIVLGRGNVVQEVSVTGRVNPLSAVDLSFEKPGRVVTVPRQVGDNVSAGDVLVRLDASELRALRAQAAANVDVALANLAEIKSGNRAEDIAISQAQKESAARAYEDARRALKDKLESAYTGANDALYNKVDHFLTNPRTTYPTLTIPVSDTKLGYQLEQKRITLESLFVAWQLDNSDAAQTENPELYAKERVIPRLSELKSYLDMLATAVNATTPGTALPQATIDSWKLDVSTARANVNAAITSVVGAEEKANGASAALTVANNQLALKRAGPTPETIAGEEAKITGLRALVTNYDVQIAKTVLSAPFAGVVTKSDAKIGESVPANTPIVSLMSRAQWKIEANVPEADVAKVTVGNSAHVTFDAYGTDVVFDAKVTKIDPAETMIEGVSTYNITLMLAHADERIRSGMTANIDINTDRREDVLFVPTRAIATKDDKKYVRVPSADGLTAVEVVVGTGLRGSDGNTEITSGLTEGQVIIMHEATP